jgi:hypothetical protein
VILFFFTGAKIRRFSKNPKRENAVSGKNPKRKMACFQKKQIKIYSCNQHSKNGEKINNHYRPTKKAANKKATIA